MIKKNTIKLFANLKCMDRIVINILNNSISLFDDDHFIKQIFTLYCINSNYNMCIYLCENNGVLNNCLYDNTFYIHILTLMCKKSTYPIVKWYLEKFIQSIDLSNTLYILESTQNQDSDVFKYILSMGKNFYSQNQWEKIFFYCVKNFYIVFAKLIYNEFPNINLMVINGISLDNSIDIYTPNYMLRWLIEICNQKNFEIKIEIKNKITISKKIYFHQIDENSFDELNKLNVNLITEECVVCFNKDTDVITNCGHKFCKECIKSWCNKNFSCPICRNSDKKIKLYSISNPIIFNS